MANLGKVGMSDEVLEVMEHLAGAIESLALELKRYNNGPPVEFAEGAAVAWKGRRTIIPPGAGDYSFSPDGVRHQWTYETSHHDHPNMADFLNCLSDAGIL